MEKETLRRLELFNQLRLTDAQKEEMTAFFALREKEAADLDAVDTENTARMVHVMPILTVVREDVVEKNFTREALQQDAPETDEGYWCVPRVLE